MVKKFCVLLVVFMILTISSIAAYAGPIEDAMTIKPSVVGAGTSTVTGSTATGTSSTSTGAGVSTGGTGTSTGASSSNSESSSAEEAAIVAKRAEFEKLFKAVLQEAEAKDNGEGIIEIISPEAPEYSIYEDKKLCILSGKSKYDDVVITIAKYNKDTKIYELMKNTDGYSSWRISDFLMFSKGIELTSGINKIKIIAYRISLMEDAKLENIQVNCFKIDVLKESILKKVIKTTVEFGNSVSNGLGFGDIFKK